MAKKRKKDTAHRLPPLSAADRTLYLSCAVLLVLGILGSIFGWAGLHRSIAFRDPAVIASRPGFSMLFLLPLLLLTETGGLVAIVCLWGGKQPLFGNPAIRYGEYPWKTDLFPIFGPRQKSMRRPDSERRFLAALKRFWIVSLLVSVLLLPFGLFERTDLREDLTLVRHDLLNRPDPPICLADDAVHLTVTAQHRLRPSLWTYGVVIRTADGALYSFSAGDFDLSRLGHESCLRRLLELKALFPAGQLRIDRAEHVDDVRRDLGLSAGEAALLQALFRPVG